MPARLVWNLGGWKALRGPLVCLCLVSGPSALCANARADLIYFRGGGAIQAPAADRDGSIVIEVGGASYAFSPDDLEKREPGFVPAEEWEARRALVATAGAAERFAAAWWALANGLTEEAADEFRAIHQADPKHAPTNRMVEILKRLDAPCADPEFADFRRALGVAVEEERGPHVLLLHQHSKAEAAARVALLERVVTAYYLTFAGSGLDPRVPDRRLVFAWFADQEDYKAFLKAQNASPFATTRGYFHPTWNAVVAYDARSNPEHRRDEEAQRGRREELNRFRKALKEMPARARARVSLAGEPARTVGRDDGAALADRLERDLLRAELLLEAQRLAFDDGIAAHEMVHLLATNSGLLPRHDAFPIWLQEGLAMQFEVVRGGRWAGVSRAHDIRLADWRLLQPRPQLESLVRDRGFGRGYRRGAYAEAWALVYFLRCRRPDQFVAYLDLLRTPATPTADRSRADIAFDAFQRAFGSDLPGLERDWRAFLDESDTPLSRHAPTPQDSRPPALTDRRESL